MNPNNETLESLEKEPKELYHASDNKELQEFESRKEKIRNPNEGPVVFATKDKAYASMFIVRSDDAWTIKGQSGNDFFIGIADRKRYEVTDKGGAIYTFATKGFLTEPNQRGIRSKEWVSRENVRPVSKQIYSSGLEAMKSLGVKIFFINYDLLREINKLFKERRNEEAVDLLFKQQEE